MEGTSELCCESGSEAGADEFQIEGAVARVKFVAEDGVSQMGEVDADLMGASGARARLDETEWCASWIFAAFENSEGGFSGLSVGVDSPA